MAIEKERLTTRVPASHKAIIEQAARITGATVNQFVLNAAVERAKELISEEESLQLDYQVAQELFELMGNPPKPTAALKKTAKLYHGSVQKNGDYQFSIARQDDT